MITIAQIGVGYWGPNLLRNLVSINRCRVKTVVDLSPDRRNFIQKLYPSVGVSGDVREVLEDPSVDAVLVATPVATHFDLAMKALHAGKHVLVEKTMAKTVAEIDEMDGLSGEKGLVAMVGHTFLYNAAVRFMKKMIDSGEIGELRYIYSRRLNLGRIRTDVDVLWNLAPHDVSIIQYWLGDPDPLSVKKHGMAYVQQGIDDVAFMTIEYPKKVLAHIHVSWLDPHRVREMTVVGSKKMVIYDDSAESKIAIYDKGIDRMAVLGEHMDYDNSRFVPFNYRAGDVLFPKINFDEPLKVEIEHFLDCIEGKGPCLTGPKHARKVIEILSRQEA